jgi:hypothetical protein
MFLPRVFHGEVGSTREVYGFGLGVDSLSVSLSTVIIWRKLLCGRRGFLAGEVGGEGSLVMPP